ncbi:MAG: hypothetical protein ACI8UD_003432 [Planctomycetota bacterium]|jgi:hypothetical protein
MPLASLVCKAALADAVWRYEDCDYGWGKLRMAAHVNDRRCNVLMPMDKVPGTVIA